MNRIVVLVSIFLLSSTSAFAKDFYVDPKTGSMTNDGSSARPWRTLPEVISAKLIESQTWDKFPYASTSKLIPLNAGAPVKAGDTIWLRSGYHGALDITAYYNAKDIIIAAQAGHTPQFSSILMRSSQKWILRGLHISPSFAPTYEKKTLLTIESHSFRGPASEIVAEQCTMFSVQDISKWTAQDWNDKSVNGIQAGGTKLTLRNNQIKNVNFGISVGATHSLIERNTVENFAGDGMRGLGDYSTFAYNTVKNCYKVNDNHDDGFQSWSVGADGKVGTGQVTGVILRGNLIINYTDPNQPLRCTLQGIGMFDGTFVDWVIENNVILVDHWHGITLLGAKNSRVVNNTVMDLNTARPGPPWISIDNHKNGTPPSGCTVRNNLTTDLKNATTGVTEDHNIIIKNAADYFVNPTTFDLHLKPGSLAIDKGVATLAPKTDRDGLPRPYGAAVDVGAYEWYPNPPKPDGNVSDAGAPDLGAPDLAPPSDTQTTDTQGPKPETQADTTIPTPDNNSSPDTGAPQDTASSDTSISPDSAHPTPDNATIEQNHTLDTPSNHSDTTQTPPGQGCGCQAEMTNWPLVGWLGLCLLLAFPRRRKRIS